MNDASGGCITLCIDGWSSVKNNPIMATSKHSTTILLAYSNRFRISKENMGILFKMCYGSQEYA